MMIKQQLERLNLPQSNWKDDASIMAARCALDKRFTTVTIEKSKPGNLSKSKIMQLIRNTTKTSTKPGGKVVAEFNLRLEMTSHLIQTLYLQLTVFWTWEEEHG